MMPSVNLTSDPSDPSDPGRWVDLATGYRAADLSREMEEVVAAGRGTSCHVRYWSGFGFETGDASRLWEHETPETVVALAEMARFVDAQNLELERFQLKSWSIESWVFAAVRPLPRFRRGRVINSDRLLVPTSAGVAVWVQTRL